MQIVFSDRIPNLSPKCFFCGGGGLDVKLRKYVLSKSYYNLLGCGFDEFQSLNPDMIIGDITYE